MTTAKVEYSPLLAHYTLLHGEEEGRPLVVFMNAVEDFRFRKGRDPDENDLFYALEELLDLTCSVDILVIGDKLKAMGLIEAYEGDRDCRIYYRIKEP